MDSKEARCLGLWNPKLCGRAEVEVERGCRREGADRTWGGGADLRKPEGESQHPQPHSPEPSGMALTKVGSIFTEAVGLVSFPSPFSISAWNRAMISKRVSSESRMWYRNLSTWKDAWVSEVASGGVWGQVHVMASEWFLT